VVLRYAAFADKSRVCGRDSKNADYRVLHGVLVRVHPDEHPRVFVSEVGRLQAVVDNIEAAQRCLGASDRSLYLALADSKARALRALRFARQLAGSAECDGSGRPLLF